MASFTTRDRIRGYSHKKEVNEFFSREKGKEGPYFKAWQEAVNDGLSADRMRVFFALGNISYSATHGFTTSADVIARGDTKPEYKKMFTALIDIASYIPKDATTSENLSDFDFDKFAGPRPGTLVINGTQADRIYHVKRMLMIARPTVPGLNPVNTEYSMLRVVLKYIRTAWAMNQMKHVYKQIPLYMRPSKIFKGLIDDPDAPALLYTFRQVDNQTTICKYLSGGNTLTASMLFEILVAKWALAKYAGIVFLDDHDDNILVQDGRPPRPYRILGEHFFIRGPMPVLIDPDDFKISQDSWIDDRGAMVFDRTIERVHKHRRDLSEDSASIERRVKSQFQAWLEIQYNQNRIEGRALDVVRTLIGPGQHTMDALSLQIAKLIEILTGRKPCGSGSRDGDCVRIKIRVTP
jgi:hypothetical protein